MFAYIGCRTTVERNARGTGLGVYRLDEGAAGAWVKIQEIGGLVNPSYLLLGTRDETLYVVHGDHYEVSAFSVDTSTGKLSFLNRESTCGVNPVHLALDASGSFLLVTNYASGSIVALPVLWDGRLGHACDLAFLPGKVGPNRTNQAGSHPHQLVATPDRRSFLVPDKGLDNVFTVSIDKESGRLSVVAPADPVVSPSAGPRHAAFHPLNAIAYVVNELASSVASYDYDSARMSLSEIELASTLPAEWSRPNTASGIAIEPSGQFLYVSNRGHDSIARLKISPDGRSLSPIGWTSSQGATPRFITLDPTGRFLLVANEGSDTIVGFRIDPVIGDLIPIGRIVETGSPVCIVFSGNRQPFSQPDMTCQTASLKDPLLTAREGAEEEV